MNAIPLNDLSRVTTSEVEQLTQIFKEICSSGTYLKGPASIDFESSLSDLFWGRKVVLVANGTDALTLAMASLELPIGSSVAVAPNAGGYSTTAAFRLDLKVSLVDVEESNGQMSPASLSVLLDSDPNVRAVVVTHLYGLTGNIQKIAEICDSRSVSLIEDCAQSIGAKVNKQPAGTFGDLATLSFYPTKNLGGLGDGGGVVCKNFDQAQKVQELAQYGWSSRYVVSRTQAFNSRIDDIQAAILHYRLNELENANARRREIVMRYSDSVSQPRRFLWANDESFVGHLAILISPDRLEDKAILESRGVQTGIHYPLLDNQQPAWQNHKNLSFGDLTSALNLNTKILTLPCFPTMTDFEIDYVCDSLRLLK